MHKKNKKKFNQRKILTFFFIFVFIFQVISNYNGLNNLSNTYRNNENVDNKGQFRIKDQLANLFLQVNSSFQNNYEFSAFGPCIIGIVITTIDFMSFTLDDEEYELSYGYNVIYKDFGGIQENHVITINNPQYLSRLYVQPVIIESREIIGDEMNLYKLNFQAGGIISLLIKPLNFPFRDLFIQIDNVTLKNDYNDEDADWTLDYIDFTQDEYYQYSMDLNPGTHSLNLMGNGTIKFLIVSEEDYDNDELRTSDEIQLSDQFSFNSIVPNIWGYYESGYLSGINGNKTNCILNIFIPEVQGTESLFINVLQGLVSELSIDDDSLLFQDMNFTNSAFIQIIYPGFHQIKYKISGQKFDAKFEINFKPIPIIDLIELRDSDGDSIKDVEEMKSGLDPFKTDTDFDGLPDSFDQSPLCKIIVISTLTILHYYFSLL